MSAPNKPKNLNLNRRLSGLKLVELFHAQNALVKTGRLEKLIERCEVKNGEAASDWVATTLAPPHGNMAYYGARNDALFFRVAVVYNLEHCDKNEYWCYPSGVFAKTDYNKDSNGRLTGATGRAGKEKRISHLRKDNLQAGKMRLSYNEVYIKVGQGVGLFAYQGNQDSSLSKLMSRMACFALHIFFLHKKTNALSLPVIYLDKHKVLKEYLSGQFYLEFNQVSLKNKILFYEQILMPIFRRSSGLLEIFLQQAGDNNALSLVSFLRVYSQLGRLNQKPPTSPGISSKALLRFLQSIENDIGLVAEARRLLRQYNDKTCLFTFLPNFSLNREWSHFRNQLSQCISNGGCSKELISIFCQYLINPKIETNLKDYICELLGIHQKTPVDILQAAASDYVKSSLSLKLS